MRTSRIIYALAGLMLLLHSCKGDIKPIGRITIEPARVLMATGETRQLTVNYLSGAKGDVSWMSDDESVATVSSDGVISAVGAGSTTVKAYSNQLTLIAECQVTVRNASEMVTGITLSEESLSLYLGQVVKLEAQVLPQTAVNKDVRWTSSDESVASVGNTGYIMSLSEGEADITATTVEGGFSQSCHVKVLPPYVNVESVSIPSELQIKVGETVKVQITILPEDATDKTVTWHSYSPSVATISETGELTGVAPGVLYIDVTSVSSGLRSQCYVTVKE